MFKSQCDICSIECGRSPTRRWENALGELGLEIVILKGDKPVGDTHLCDDCILKMFWIMLERYPESPLRKMKEGLFQREAKVASIQAGLESKLEEYKSLLADFEARSKELSRQEAEISAKKKLLLDQAIYGMPTESSNQISQRIEREIKIAEARGYQRAIDEREYPEYISAIALRNSKVRG